MTHTVAERQRSLETRFTEKYDVDRDTGCWLWNAHKDKDGYGRIQYAGKAWRANRIAWLIHHGDIQKGRIICHTCDVTACVNPEHLYLGTHKSNMRDKVDRHREAPQQGEQNHFAKLSNVDVRNICAVYKLCSISQSSLATIYNVTQSAICYAINKHPARVTI